jgi:hypothetical protein
MRIQACSIARQPLPVISTITPRAKRAAAPFLATLGATVLLAMPSSALADLRASAMISTGSTTAPYDYSITLNNIGTTDVGTFLFAWTDAPANYDFLPSSPTVTGMPSGWIAPVTHNGIPGDGYAIEYYNISGSPIAPGGSSTFAFTSPDSPMTINGDAFISPDKVATSFVYIGFPQADPGFNFNMTVVSQLSGDANFDGIVNGQDIALVASNWLSTGSGLSGDVNADGIVNGQDIALIASDWLHTSGGGAGSRAAVPEPATLVLGALGGLALLAYRRRAHCA